MSKTIDEIKNKANNCQDLDKNDCLRLAKYLLESKDSAEVLKIYQNILANIENLLIIHPLVWHKIVKIYNHEMNQRYGNVTITVK